MADAIRFTVRGDKALYNALLELEPKMRRKVLQKAANTAMRPVLVAARANAPKKSGDLRRSIKSKTLKRNRKGYIGQRVITSDDWFKGEQFYGAFQEFGWKTGIRKVREQWLMDRKDLATDSLIVQQGVAGKVWVRRYKRKRPDNVYDVRLNKTDIARKMSSRRIPGKHFVERAYDTHGEQAMRRFMAEVPRLMEQGLQDNRGKHLASGGVR